MRYLCCVWLCIVWLVCHAQTRVNGLHIEKAPEIIQRITRQATRYGSGGGGGSAVSSVAGPNYRPVAASASNYNVRNVDTASAIVHQGSGGSGQRVGVGAFSFGGMASGRPTNGNSFAVNTASHGKVINNALKGSVLGGGGTGGVGLLRPQPQANQAIVGNISKQNNQLQQALLQAAQFQLQQKQQYQQQHQQQQYQQQRRQAPPQGYRQRPAPNYQQFKK